MSCLFQTGQFAALFGFPNNLNCVVEYKHEKCQSPCENKPVDCPNNQTYRINVTVSPSWHKNFFFCSGPFGGYQSNTVTLDVLSNTFFS